MTAERKFVDTKPYPPIPHSKGGVGDVHNPSTVLYYLKHSIPNKQGSDGHDPSEAGSTERCAQARPARN